MVPLERLTHIGLGVSDLGRSLRFYRDLLGFRPVHELEVEGEPAATLLGLPDVKLRAAYLERDGVTLELLHFARPPGVQASAWSARRRSQDPRRRARDAPRMTPPALPPPGPKSVSATRGVSRKGVARSAAPPARGKVKASD